MGIKPEAPKAYLTPSPGAYVPEKSEKYLQEKISHSLGIKLPSPKPYVTPAPSAYRPEECKPFSSCSVWHEVFSLVSRRHTIA